MLRYIFASLFVAAAWGVVYYFELPYWIAGSVTAVVAAIIAAVLGFRFAKNRKASKEIERALKAQAEQQANSARPDLEADIRSMQEEFTRAINALKGSRLGARGASSALYSLPWYVIVGPPGVGKSTALRNSGLKFPFSSSRGGVSVQGVGGTRNCEWWMTSEAVILDTAGRYTTEGADREEWFAFLDLLRKYRTRRPLNGVLAAVSVADIAEAHPEEVASLAREIRARVDELQDRLGVVIPVYVMFTKCDLLPGFVEMFGDLSEQERHQIWGFTLKVNDQLALADQCSQNMDELTALLEKRALRRMAEERSLARRDKIHEHPQYIAQLRDPIARFVHELTEPNIYHETPILRGVYLTSGTQEGRPLSRIMNSISEAFGLRPTMGGVTAAPVDAKSYFLGEIFRKVIFPDYRLVRHNRTRTRKSRIIGIVAGAVSLVTAAAIVWLPLVSFGHNRDLLGKAGTSFAYVEQHIEQDTVDVIQMDRIEPLRALLELLEQYEDDGSPWSMRMGMYQGGRIYPRVRDVFVDTVRRQLLVPTMEREVEELDNFIQRYGLNNDDPTTKEYEENFDRLRAYLLTTTPAGPGEPGLDEAESEWLAARLAALWEAPIAVSAERTSRSSIEAVAETYVELLAAQPELAFQRDDTMVQQARDILDRADRTKAVANALIASVTGPSITLKKLVTVSSIRDDGGMVRPAFTRAGYQRQIQPMFEEGLAALLDPPWVLAPGNEEAQALQEEELIAIQTEYFRQYIAEWKGFVDRIYVYRPKQATTGDTLRLLEELTRSEPYRDLFTQIAWHTTLANPEAAADDAGGEGESRIEKELKRAGERAVLREGSTAVSRVGGARMGLGAGIIKAGFDMATEKRAAANPNDATILTPYTVTMVFAPLAAFGANVEQPPAPEDGPPVNNVAQKKPLDAYIEQLKYVRDAVRAREDDPSKKEELIDQVKKAQGEVKSLLDNERDSTWRPLLQSWLLPPLQMAKNTSTGDLSKERSDKWCNGVVASFERRLSGGYPFNKSGQDVALADFATFFHPDDGEVWEYYNDVLKGAVPKVGGVYEMGETGPSGSLYRPNVVSFLNAANEVSQSMFPRGAKEPKVEFKVRLQGSPSVKEVALTVDGKTIKYRNGPLSWGELQWPGEGTPGATIEVRGFSSRDELARDGDWGLMRLLEEGNVRRVEGKRIFRAQWDFSDEGLGVVQIEFQPERIDTPFYGMGGRKSFMSIFRTKKLAVPRSILKKSGGCKRGR